MTIWRKDTGRFGTCARARVHDGSGLEAHTGDKRELSRPPEGIAVRKLPFQREVVCVRPELRDDPGRGEGERTWLDDSPRAGRVPLFPGQEYSRRAEQQSLSSNKGVCGRSRPA